MSGLSGETPQYQSRAVQRYMPLAMFFVYVLQEWFESLLVLLLCSALHCLSLLLLYKSNHCHHCKNFLTTIILVVVYYSSGTL